MAAGMLKQLNGRPGLKLHVDGIVGFAYGYTTAEARLVGLRMQARTGAESIRRCISGVRLVFFGCRMWCVKVVFEGFEGRLRASETSGSHGPGRTSLEQHRYTICSHQLTTSYTDTSSTSTPGVLVLIPN